MHQRVALKPGLAIIQYETDGDGNYNARIEVGVPDGYPAVFDPSCNGPVLEHPGQCVVVSCEQAVKVDLWLESIYSDEAVCGAVKVKYLTNEAQQESRRQKAAKLGARAAQPKIDSDLSVIGHLSNQGDVRVSAGEWLGGPDAPNQIEGVTVDWPGCPADLEFSVRDPMTGQTNQLSQFVGSKGRALPMSGVEFALGGGGSDRYQIVAEAVFASAGLVREKGRNVSLIGENRLDQLTGLNLKVIEDPAFAKPAPEAKAVTSEQPKRSPTFGTQRTRIFRT